MTFQRKSRCVWNLVLVLVSMALFATSRSTGPIESNAQSIKTDPREELVRSLKGANVQGFDFATSENDAQARAILIKDAAKDLIRLGNSDTNLVLQYTSVKNKKTNTTKTFKTEIVKRGKSLSLVTTDLGNQTVSQQCHWCQMMTKKSRHLTAQKKTASTTSTAAADGLRSSVK